MPSADITTCASLHCPKRWRCAVHYSNNDFGDAKFASHHDPYRPEIGGCEWFREVEVQEMSNDWLNVRFGTHHVQACGLKFTWTHNPFHTGNPEGWLRVYTFWPFR